MLGKQRDAQTGTPSAIKLKQATSNPTELRLKDKKALNEAEVPRTICVRIASTQESGKRQQSVWQDRMFIAKTALAVDESQKGRQL